MQKKIASILFSTRLLGLLFIVYFVAMAVGTFLDQGQETSPTPYSRYYIYDAWWFTAIHVLFVINFIGNITRYNLLRKEKITTLIFHSSFILILFGAGITRYISYEGVMPIEEGASESTFLSEKTYLQVFIDGEQNGQPMRRQIEKELSLSPRLDNDFTWTEDFAHSTTDRNDKTNFTFSFNKFIDGAEDGFVEDVNGVYHLKIVEAGDGTRHEHFLVEGEVVSIHNVLYAFNAPQDGAVNINFDGENYTIKTPFGGTNTVMATQTESIVVENVEAPLNLRALYNLGGGVQFVIPEPAIKGKTGIVEKEVKEKTQEDALFVNVSVNGETKTIGLLGGRGYSNDKKELQIGGHKLYLSYGSKALPLPFSIKLNDFIAERYPGTENSYASFESKITVEDPENTFDYDIYMNHVLDHKGFRFFQASFFPDESGTILSVSHDFWGTWVTYIGYFLLYLGLMMILFDKGSRFGDLKRMLDKVKVKKSKLALLLIMFAFAKANTIVAQEDMSSASNEVSKGNVVIQDTIATSSENIGDILGLDSHTTETHQQTMPSQEEIKKLIVENAVPIAHAEKFGRLIIQEDGGRMMPINTFSSMLLRKLSRSDTYEGLTADQVMLSMMENPQIWTFAELIYLKKGNDSLRNVVGVPSDRKYFKQIDFFTQPTFNYKLAPFLPEAYAEINQTKIAKEFTDVDQRLGLLDRTLVKEILKIFPKPDDANNKWLSPIEVKDAGFRATDSVIANQIFPAYLLSLKKGRTSGDYSDADKVLAGIEKFQRKNSNDIMPSAEKVDAEILYNKYDVFKKLYWMYMLAAFFMMMFVITAIFKENRFVSTMIKIGLALVILLFTIHTGALIWRWYISGHAPWSDAYESVLYVGWATMFFGLGFGRKSMLTVASTAFVAGFILWAASMNWMNPEIANLQAVLNSYWLMIHTAVIVASYGPFTLGAILGLVSLFLMIFTTEKNKKKMDLNIKELTIINEMALTVGMVLLAIGTFLGGQWANESWGRYWGWDPKETWALISLIVYAFVIHMRLIPGLRGRWLFNFLSILSLGSILFTYFGVNYYLSGLHAYQSGGDIASQKILISLAVIAVIGILSFWKYKKHYKKSKSTSVQVG
ncbi:cytochrome c biogenesis protein CcsA [Dokdonia sp. Hel_I_53]|uniref:cytochrome c biogenesis protein CcsA n=1 Tax=Dokdonia sp. Hel_I_53 TaxID=1566287 RepID=UPI001198E1E7|nr:cytochrome c biogenesis protein CcsA [Dokdonia sp. Hel_I_53]TVZ51536.1 cytochrome c-type biogenesis protein CcsB [Dokdonia sp. Hel_I_53]